MSDDIEDEYVAAVDKAYRAWLRWADANNVKQVFVCSECGAGAYSDEDGCCASCGITLTVWPPRPTPEESP